MRAYILTENEREIINQYLNHGNKQLGHSMLKHRIDKNLKTVNNDLKLIENFLKKVKEMKDPTSWASISRHIPSQ
jgi:hypothetical protein